MQYNQNKETNQHIAMGPALPLALGRSPENDCL